MELKTEKKPILNGKEDSCDSAASIPGSGGDGDAGGDGDRGEGSGLSVLTTCLFMVGELAGIGVLALPEAVERTGYIGAVMILLACIGSCYTGILLGESWAIVQARYSEYSGLVRDPYPTIAYVTYGNVGRTVLSCCSNITMLGSVVLALILSSQNIQTVLQDLFQVDVSFCLIQVIVTAVMMPVTWFGTPKDFWGVGLAATVTTSIAVVLCLVVVIRDSVVLGHSGDVGHSRIKMVPFFQSLGSICFATGGQYAFLTFRNDMKQPSKFKKSMMISFTGTTMLYVPFAVVGYLVYGRDVTSNVLLSMNPGPLPTIVILLITCHQFCAIVIFLNPVVQHLEELVNLSKSFSWKRVVLRSSVFLVLLFVAESIPSFGDVLSLVGGSTNIVIMLVAPPLFYLKLCGMPGEWPQIVIPLHIKVLLIEIIAVGLLIIVFSTYGNILSLWGTTDSLALPCYLSG